MPQTEINRNALGAAARRAHDAAGETARLASQLCTLTAPLAIDPSVRELWNLSLDLQRLAEYTAGAAARVTRRVATLTAEN